MLTSYNYRDVHYLSVVCLFGVGCMMRPRVWSLETLPFLPPYQLRLRRQTQVTTRVTSLTRLTCELLLLINVRNFCILSHIQFPYLSSARVRLQNHLLDKHLFLLFTLQTVILVLLCVMCVYIMCAFVCF